MLKVFFAVLTLLPALVSSQILITPYLVNNGWVVEQPSPCPQSSCCCFTGPVNIYASSSGELNINGTAAGSKCTGKNLEDNLNPTTDFTFTQEFNGIDDYSWVLSNGTYESTAGWTFSATDASTSCSFTLFLASATPLPPAPPITTPTAAPVPTYAEAFLGYWEFDSLTCAINNASCCCLVGNSSVTVQAGGASEFMIAGPASKGCTGASANVESDNFPFPASGSSTSATTSVQDLFNGDDYVISVTLSASNYDVLLLQDQTNPICSMKATRSLGTTTTPAPTLQPSSASNNALNALVVFAVTAIAAISSRYAY